MNRQAHSPSTHTHTASTHTFALANKEGRVSQGRRKTNTHTHTHTQAREAWARAEGSWAEVLIEHAITLTFIELPFTYALILKLTITTLHY